MKWLLLAIISLKIKTMNEKQKTYIDWLEDTLEQAGFLTSEEREEAIENLKDAFLPEEEDKLVEYLQQVEDETINEYTIEVSKEAIKKAEIDDNGNIMVRFCEDGESKWTGCLQGVKLDEKGETTGYWVYTY